MNWWIVFLWRVSSLIRNIIYSLIAYLLLHWNRSRFILIKILSQGRKYIYCSSGFQLLLSAFVNLINRSIYFSELVLWQISSFSVSGVNTKRSVTSDWHGWIRQKERLEQLWSSFDNSLRYVSSFIDDITYTSNTFNYTYQISSKGY